MRPLAYTLPPGASKFTEETKVCFDCARQVRLYHEAIGKPAPEGLP